jgi:ubiquinone/menaquinone biosynthesis C-methylase UbiE
MLKEAENNLSGNKAVQFKRASLVNLPFPNEYFGGVACLAALHHLRTPASRIKALKEFERVLEPGGVLVATVWNGQQEKFAKLHADSLIPWRQEGSDKPVKRYYHFFKPIELEGLALNAGFGSVRVWGEKNGVAHRVQGAHNLCLRGIKQSPQRVI